MRFIGLRHGQSSYNLQHLCNDEPKRNVRLTELGVRQAQAAVSLLREGPPTAIYCSPLPRTVQTAEIVRCREFERDLTVCVGDSFGHGHGGLRPTVTVDTIADHTRPVELVGSAPAQTVGVH